MRRPLARFAGFAALVAAMGSTLLVAQASAPSDITYQDLLQGLKNPSRWLTYSGDYTGQRHSPLKQITPDNAHRLSAQWTFQTGIIPRRGFEGTPLVVDGVVYLTGPFNSAWALDARTGRPFWRYRRELPNNLTYGAVSPVNRGFGLLGDRLFMVTPDAHLLAIDAKTGTDVWDVVLADYRIGYAATMAPLVIRDKVIVGISGGDFPTRGFLDAYDPRTGARIWRFYTVPGPGEPGSETWPAPDVMARGGGATWVTGSYDPELNLLYWGTGNPNPLYYGDDRKGDNLYTASIVAIDADTGKLRWYFQFSPHDTHDWDSNQIPVLADLTIGGQPRKVVMFANRNGFFYVFDRATGKLLLAKPFTDTTWAREIGPDGRPIVLNDGSKGCLPDQWGGTNHMPPSFDPVLRLFFVTTRETCATYIPRKEEIVPGRISNSGVVQRDAEHSYGVLRAIDPATVERRWEFKYPTPTMAGVMSTASGVVFAGDNEGNFMAFDARTGKNLWYYPTGSAIWGAAPMTYMLDGRQQVLIGSGTTVTAFALPDADPSNAPRPPPPKDVRLYVFDCGVLKIADPMPLFGLKKEEVAATDLSDAAYLIVHPRGTLMWEAGLVPDANIGAPNARPGAPTKRLEDQMAEIGYRPEDITYFAISHGHGDHTANANDFRGSTWLVNRAEYDVMFAEKAPRFYSPATYAALKNSKTVFVPSDRNYDVFGDGTVLMMPTPGHTPGHTVLVVKLKRTGTVALTGDLYHYAEEVNRKEVAPAQGDQERTLKSRDALQTLLKKTGGQMWITHDLPGFSRLKKSPEYYE